MANQSPIAVPYILELTAFLLTVVVVVPLCKRMKISPVLGFLLVGAAIGPDGLSIINDGEGVRHLAELGVVFLLFTIGLELSFERLAKFSKLIFGFGLAQVLISALVIGGVAYLWQNPLETAIVIGLCLALSSTAMVMQLLGEHGEAFTQHGRAAFAVLLFQDLAVVPILILVSILGGDSELSAFASLALALFKAVVTVGGIVLLGRFGLRQVFRLVSTTRSVDVFTAVVLLTVLAASLATGYAGLSMALGAFLAGLLLAETEFQHQVEAEIEPFKGLFLGLFFMGVGMTVDFDLALGAGRWVALAVVGLLTFKAIIATVCGRLAGLDWRTAFKCGLLLAAGGEFAFVVLGQASYTFDLIEPAVAQFMIVVAGLSMVATPLLAAAGRLIGESGPPVEDNDTALHGHVLVLGYGRVGQQVVSVLEREQIPFLAVDIDASRAGGADRGHVMVGDPMKSDLLDRAGVGNARAAIITLDDPKAAEGLVHRLRAHWQLPIVARARDAAHAHALERAGANVVVQELEAASRQLGHALLLELGYTSERVAFALDRAGPAVNPAD